ncbi:MAG: LTA synthase family protein [Streptococcaceae bacterium]|jgi:lipoteichoic acid synthase|nr:LTA synthase family protein [Streptococcaceae bacterium]
MKAFKFLNRRLGLVWTIIFLIWLKTIFAYFLTMQSLHSTTIWDYFLMLINPIGFTAVILSLTLFIKPKRFFYLSLSLLAVLGTLMTYMNVVYYREFSGFMTINTIVGGAGMMGHGFDLSAIPIHWLDILYWADLLVLLALFLLKKIKMDEQAIGSIRAFKIFSLSFMLFSLNFWLADLNEHRLISRQAQYDITYVVRYMGLGPAMVTNGWYSQIANQARTLATKSDFTKVQNYIKTDRYLAPSTQMFSVGKNRNLIVIHLESFQQSLIDLSIKNPTTNQDEVVTPFLNSIYHSNSSYSFSNFFNQVGYGKTSDAETMLETSTFGLSTGSSLFTQFGSTQTFQAMPAILNQTDGYSSAVFHGNVGSFYNRINTYRQMGYQNFFDQSFWNYNSATGTGFGLKDKLLFSESVPWLEQLQQPFYVKYLTVTNHDPYLLPKEDQDPNFTTVDSGSATVDGYFETAHYLDQSVKEFYDYLKKSGLYDHSIIVLYGDHYGISGSNNKYFAPYVAQRTGIDTTNLTDFDSTMLQRVPFMIDIPGQTGGHIVDTYGGEIDVMPTLEHLLGVPTDNYIQLGQDLFSSGRADFVALRNRGFITPTITEPNPSNQTYYDTKTGQVITPTASQLKYIQDTQNKVNQLLDMSDRLNTENLLRFYTPAGFSPVDASQYSYTVAGTTKRLKAQQAELKARSTSLLSENGGNSTRSEYITDAPEITNSSSSSASSSTSGTSSSTSKKN